MHKKNFPKLYLKTENNKIRTWELWITYTNDKKIAFIHKKYGLIDGKQTTPKPKKIEHKGTISSYDKALTLAKYQIKKKKEKGFSLTKNSVIKKEDVILPMGAHKINDNLHKIKYPAYCQRKLDGFRCMSHITKGKVELLSKSGKNFHHLEDIREEIKKIKLLCDNNSIYLDGELYVHSLPLRKISSIVMKKYITPENSEKMKCVNYFIFDMFNIKHKDLPFEKRFKIVEKIFKSYKFKYLKLVKINTVKKKSDIDKFYQKFINEGYEGIIVRNKDGLYKFNKKSYDVLRTKEFKTSEFKIVGYKDGSGEQKGAVIWKLECNKKKQKYFWGNPIGSLNDRKKLYKNASKYIGKMVTVKYWDIDKDGCIIRNPIVSNLI